MPVLLSALIIFIVGFVQEVIITRLTQAIVEERQWLALLLSTFNTIIAVAVFDLIIAELSGIFLYKLINTLSYAISGGLGVALTIIYKRKRHAQ